MSLRALSRLAVLTLMVCPLSCALAQTTETIAVGVITPLTGVRAEAGDYCRKALELAQQDLAAKNLRYQPRFIFEDSKYEPPAAVDAAKKLIALDKVRFILGAYGSAETLSVAPVAEKARVILISPGSQAAEISDSGDYIFRVIHNITQEAPFFGKFVASRMHSDTLHFLAVNTGVGPTYLKYFRPVLEGEGKKVGLTEEFDARGSDFRPQLLRIKTQHPTDIFLVASPAHVPLILRQAKELGLSGQFYNVGVEGPEILSAGNLAEGLLYAYSYDAYGEAEEVKRFHEAYLQTFGAEPDAVAANSYDAAMLLSRCFERVGIEVDAVKRCLYGTRNYAGASGTFDIDAKGDAVKTLFVKTVRNGKFVRE